VTHSKGALRCLLESLIQLPHSNAGSNYKTEDQYNKHRRPHWDDTTDYSGRQNWSQVPTGAWAYPWL